MYFFPCFYLNNIEIYKNWVYTSSPFGGGQGGGKRIIKVKKKITQKPHLKLNLQSYKKTPKILYTFYTNT